MVKHSLQRFCRNNFTDPEVQSNLVSFACDNNGGPYLSDNVVRNRKGTTLFPVEFEILAFSACPFELESLVTSSTRSSRNRSLKKFGPSRVGFRYLLMIIELDFDILMRINIFNQY